MTKAALAVADKDALVIKQRHEGWCEACGARGGGEWRHKRTGVKRDGGGQG